MIHTKDRAKDIGQFFTPAAVANAMVSMMDTSSVNAGSKVKVLDPGAGKGILGITLAKELIKIGAKVELTSIEIDPLALKYLEQSLQACKMENHEQFTYIISTESFFKFAGGGFDLTILNPPYFKVNKADSLTIFATERLYKGCPNAYASFMALAIETLKLEGQMVAITPRSFTNGADFKGFREYLKNKTALTKYHLLHSRKEAFGSQKVLQETVITHYKVTKKKPSLILAYSSNLFNIDAPNLFHVNLNNVYGSTGIIRMPLNKEDADLLEWVHQWPCSLSSLGLQVSTGPVVEHRAKELIATERAFFPASVPLIRMHNVRCGLAKWTGDHRKDGYFSLTGEKQLIPNKKGMLLLKRFTAKEEKRRLVTARLSKELQELEYLAVENHLNYIVGDLLSDELFSRGFCVLLNSELLDNYFRITSGNTQVNATDLRSMPFPNDGQIKSIGEESIHSNIQDHDACSDVVKRVLA